jgi:hypothetical protein
LVDAFDAGQASGEDVELAISLAATLLVQLVGSPSNRVVLAVAGAKADAVIGGGSSGGKRRMLELLADVEPTAQPVVDQAAKKAIQIVGRSQDLIMISPRSLEQVKQADPHVRETIAPWVRRGTFRWIDVRDRSLDRWIARDPVPRETVSRDDQETVTKSSHSEVS